MEDVALSQTTESETNKSQQKKVSIIPETLLTTINWNIGYRRTVEVVFKEGDNFFELSNYEKSASGGASSKVQNKSIQIPLIYYKVFLQHLEEIKGIFERAQAGEPVQYSLHLGGLVYLRIDKNIRCVDWRKHYIPKESLHAIENLSPGLPGVGLKFAEFDAFLRIIDKLSELSEIDTVVACVDSEDHKVLTNIQKCKICNPMKLFY